MTSRRYVEFLMFATNDIDDKKTALNGRLCSTNQKRKLRKRNKRLLLSDDLVEIDALFDA